MPPEREPGSSIGAGEVFEHLSGRPDLGAARPASPGDVTFLARGEYSLNFRVRCGADDGAEGPGGAGLVARLVTGTQMGLPLGEQALYEHDALRVLAPSGATPEPYLADPSPAGLPYPLILEEFLPGRPLDYSTDLAAAARCVAAVHALGVPERHGLQIHPDPVPSILTESERLAAPYLSWEAAPEESKDVLRTAFAEVGRLLDREELFAGELGIVNYDLNTHNFVVENGRARLLDWEKARIAPVTQDLAHFLLPTTTLWRDESATLLSEAQEREFLDAYLERNPADGASLFLARLEATKTVVALRAVSWCAWALQETARGTRPITNEETLARSRAYLEPRFLRDLFGLRGSVRES